MAEYVRRRRPPADHSYWERLRDRAHPPRVVLPILILALLGGAFGLYGGLKPTFTIADAIKLAAMIAGGFAGVGMAVFLPFWIVDSAFRSVRYERAVTILAGSAAIVIFVFIIAFAPLAILFIAFSICTGQGPWIGMLIGLLCTTTLTVPLIWSQRVRWQARQRAWPRWDRMRAPRRRAPSNAGTEVVLQVEETAAVEPAVSTKSPPINSAASENMDGQVGESNERV